MGVLDAISGLAGRVDHYLLEHGERLSGHMVTGNMGAYALAAVAGIVGYAFLDALTRMFQDWRFGKLAEYIVKAPALGLPYLLFRTHPEYAKVAAAMCIAYEIGKAAMGATLTYMCRRYLGSSG